MSDGPGASQRRAGPFFVAVGAAHFGTAAVSHPGIPSLQHRRLPSPAGNAGEGIRE
jgi:hypothetical protein